MKRTVWVFGLISGGIMAALMLVTVPFIHQLDLDKAEVIGYTSMVLAFLLVYFGIRSYRDNVGGGRIGFGRAFTVGILITLISSTCYVATWEVLNATVFPNFAADYGKHQIDRARASGASEQAIKAQVAEMQRFEELYKNPFYNVAMTFIEPFPVGLVITLVAAGILSRKKAKPERVVAVATS